MSLDRYAKDGEIPEEEPERDQAAPLIPPMPDHEDRVGQCQWLSTVFSFDPRHPVIGGERQGSAGPRGHAVLRRHDAGEIRFAPITVLSEPRKLIPILSSYKLATDGMVPSFKGEHCRLIFHVIGMLCTQAQARTDAQETEAIIGDLILIGEEIKSPAASPYTFRGTMVQRYEAAHELPRQIDERTGRYSDRPRYLIEKGTGEIVVAASELQAIARKHLGATMSHGWLDAMLEGIGWEKVTIDAREVPGRKGRHSRHRRVTVYRGIPKWDDGDDDEGDDEGEPS